MRANVIAFRVCTILLSIAAWFWGLSSIAVGQLERAEAAMPKQVVTGRVSMPDGSPVRGAVVVTSGGGQAVTAVDGRFELEVELPPDAESLEVTAVADEPAGSGSLVAKVRVVPAALSPRVSVGRLVLMPSRDCHPRWLPTFGGQPGTNERVYALLVHDDGSGRALYAGGSFTTAGGLRESGIAKWDGARWSSVGGGVSDTGSVRALTVYDSGSGPALHAAGGFTVMGDVQANRIANWDGTSWSALGSGVNGTVAALTVYDDGGGPALYAAGGFTTAGGAAANNIARWDGTSWSALGSGLNGGVQALTVHDDGTGPALYAGGFFTSAGGTQALRIAKWDGASWAPLGSGITGGNAYINGLSVFDDGGGLALYAGGEFTNLGGVAANRVAKWDGNSWSALGSGMDDTVLELAVLDDGSGPALHAGGEFAIAGGVSAKRVAKWNGTSWSALGGGMVDGGFPRVVEAMALYDDGGGPVLYAGGRFSGAGGVAVNNIAKWDGTSWAALGSGFDDWVLALTAHDDGTGSALYAAGAFTSAPGVAAQCVAKWDGSTWSALGNDWADSGGGPEVRALTVYDDGGGPALYAGGSFIRAGGVAANHIAKWNGSSWSRLLTGVSDLVYALTVYDDGGGPALYAGGPFGSAGGGTALRIARWDGSIWSAVGSGIGINGDVRALTVFDDGGGPALYAGGTFPSAGGVSSSRIAKWNGTSWSALGSGLTGGYGGTLVHALAVHDDGGGPALYVGGRFTSAGGVAANNIARWDGTNWSALGGGLGVSYNEVHALTVSDDGDGPRLFAGGLFGRKVTKWDGSSWTTIGIGVSDRVLALASWNGDGPALYAGGYFSASPAGDSFLAKWGCGSKAKRRRL